MLDLLIRDTRIRTVNPGRPTATALGIWDGQIVGLDEEVLGLPASRVVAAGGAVLVPGFHDAHCHTTSFGLGLVLLDLTGVPGADYEAARLCRRTRPSLTIIALSGDLPEEAEARAQEIGLDAILPKPVEPSRLIAAINAALQGDAGSPEVVARLAPRAVVTELASHPRFAAEAANSAADDRAIAALRSTGRGSGEFLQSVIDAFRADSRLIVADIAKAARADDLRAFDEGIEALHDRRPCQPRQPEDIAARGGPSVPSQLEQRTGAHEARHEPLLWCARMAHRHNLSNFRLRREKRSIASVA